MLASILHFRGPTGNPDLLGRVVTERATAKVPIERFYLKTSFLQQCPGLLRFEPTESEAAVLSPHYHAHPIYFVGPGVDAHGLSRRIVSGSRPEQGIASCIRIGVFGAQRDGAVMRGCLRVKDEMIENKTPTRSQLAVDVAQPGALALHRHQMPNGVEGDGDQFSRLGQGEVTEVSMYASPSGVSESFQSS
jgi:hypothetical protein